VDGMTVHIDEQPGRWETPTITNCQGLLDGSRQAHRRGGNEPGSAPLHALSLTPASYRGPPTNQLGSMRNLRH
jgi:hypothetical protein